MGTGDEDNLTSLGGIDLYQNPLDHLPRIENLRGHPYEFYRKLCFVIVGVTPDANGFGKPDIFFGQAPGRPKGVKWRPISFAG